MTGAFLAALTARLRRELEAADAARAAETWHAADMLGLARELAEAIDQGDRMLFLAIDAEGNVLGHGESTLDAIDEAEFNGWRGWFSKDRVDEKTLRIVPASKVRVRAKN